MKVSETLADKKKITHSFSSLSRKYYENNSDKTPEMEENTNYKTLD